MKEFTYLSHARSLGTTTTKLCLTTAAATNLASSGIRKGWAAGPVFFDTVGKNAKSSARPFYSFLRFEIVMINSVAEAARVSIIAHSGSDGSASGDHARCPVWYR